MVMGGGMKAGLRVAGKVIGRLLLVLVILVLVVAVSFLLAPARRAWLGVGMDAALRSLPGEVSGDWFWPHLNRFEVHNLVWTVPRPGEAGVDTLAAVESLAVQFDLQALGGHELRVEEISAQASLVDVPQILAILPPARTVPDSLAPGAGIPFLREGSLPGLPSAGINNVDLSLGRLVLPGGLEAVQLALSGSASALTGEAPHLAVKSLRGRASSRAPSSKISNWQVDLESLQGAARYDLATRSVTIDSIAARIPTASLATDTLNVDAGPLDISASGFWGPDGWNLKSNLDLRVAVPAPLQNPIAGITMREFTGHLMLGSHGTGDTAWLDVALDLDPSADVKLGTLRGRLLANLKPKPTIAQVNLDDFKLQWRGTTLEATGQWAKDMVEGRVMVDLADLELPKLLAPGLLPGVEGRVRVDGSVFGKTNDPQVTGKVSASGGVASVWALRGVTEAAAGLPEGFPRGDFRQVELDLEAGFEGSLSRLAVDIRADLSRTPWLDRGLLVGQAEVVPRAKALSFVKVDSLAVSLRGTEILAAGTLDTMQADLRGKISLAGTDLMELVAPGALPGASLDLKAALQVSGPWRDLSGEADLGGQVVTKEFEALAFQAKLAGSVREIQAEVRAQGGVRLGTVVLDSLDAGWTGSPDSSGGLPSGKFTLHGWAPGISGWLRGSAAGDSMRIATIDTLVFTAAGQVAHSAGPTTMRMGPGPGNISLSGLRLRGDLGRLDIEGRFAPTGLTAAASTDLLLTREWLDTLFPSPFWSAGKGVDLKVQGEVALSTAGSSQGEDPLFQGRAGLQLVPRNDELPAILDLEFRLAQGDTAGLLADLSFGMGDTPLVHGSFFWPGTIEPASGRWLPAEGADGGINIPEQELPLAFFNRFLPAEVSLEGHLSVGAGLAVAPRDSTALPVTDSSVTGIAHTQDLRVNLPNRSWVDVAGEVGLEGRLIDPRLAGQITVNAGLFRLQEIQRTLHPVSGNSALWMAARAEAADSTDHEKKPLWTSDLPIEDPAAPYVPDLDLKVKIPGKFQVVGYGLEAELAGDFTVSRGWDEKGRPAPVLRGNIQVVEGTLRALNRIFEVERGEIELEGRIPVDPALNLVLMTDIDGTIIRIKVTGTALQPKITLESEPEMIQADIMAFLLFGRPLNDLDTDQRGTLGQEQTPVQQLRQNLQGLALVFGASGLQNRVSGKIGVDQVQIGSDSAGGSTLVLGKFVNPRLLLKYHQSLERGGTYFMTLEYTLSRVFKLISTYGQGEESSGLELRWQRRY